jgi:hypothetical protein
LIPNANDHVRVTAGAHVRVDALVAQPGLKKLPHDGVRRAALEWAGLDPLIVVVVA